MSSDLKKICRTRCAANLFSLTLIILPQRTCFFLSKTVELDIAEVERDVDRNLDEVENVEEEAQVEYESRAAAAGLDYLAGDTAGITDQKENLEEEALAFRGAGDKRLAD